MRVTELALMPLPVLLVACGAGRSAFEVPSPAPPAKARVEIVALPPSRGPIVAIRLLFRSGSADDPPGLEGATRLAARLMAEGGTEALSAQALKRRLFPWAVQIGTQVSKEMSVFTVRVHRDHVWALLPILSDVLLRPRWAPPELERLRRDALDDLRKRLRSNDDEALGKEALGWLLYQGHPYSHPDVGTVSGLRAISMERLRAHARRVFGWRRLTIGLAGGYPAGLGERLRERLAALPEGAPPARPLLPGPASPVRLLIIEKPAGAAPSVAISMGYRVPWGRADPDFHALRAVESAFGEHRQFTGRLMKRLREARGLNYGDYAYMEHFEQAGWSTLPATNVARTHQYFSIWLRPVSPEAARFAIRAALYEYDLLLRDGLTQAEIDTARRFLAGYTRLWEKTADRRLGFALDDRFYGTPHRLDRLRGALETLDRQAVNQALRSHLLPRERLKIVVVTRNAAAFRDAVVSGAPSPSPKPASERSAEQQVLDARVAALPFGISASEVQIVEAAALFE